MTIAALKTELHDKIEHADEQKLEGLYKVVSSYLNDEEIEEWDLLPQSHKDAIEEGLKQLDAGERIPAKEAIKNLREKYGLNG